MVGIFKTTSTVNRSVSNTEYAITRCNLAQPRIHILQWINPRVRYDFETMIPKLL